MKVVLLEDVKGQGKKGDLINASDGFAKNYLFPKKLAKEANAQILNDLKNKKESEEHRKSEEKKQALAWKEELKDYIIEFQTTGGADGRLYSAVTAKDVAEKIKADRGYEIDKKKIVLSENIKTVGEYTVSLKLYPEISTTVKLIVKA